MTIEDNIKISLVVAVAANNVIGADGGLAWRISDDLKWFKKVTVGKPVIMGRKTFESIGKALPGRRNIVVTRSACFAADGVDICSSLEEAVEMARKAAMEMNADEIAIIGGGEIYRQTIATADRIYLTRVDADVEGDAYFPEIDSSEWIESAAGSCEKSQQNEYGCEFVILDRTN